MRAWLVLDDLTAADIERHDADTATFPVRAVVTVLAILTVVGGLVVFTPLLDLGGHIGWLVALLSVLLIVGAGLAVRSLADGEDPAVRIVGARMPLFDNGFGVDRLYVESSPGRSSRSRTWSSSSTVRWSTPTFEARQRQPASAARAGNGPTAPSGPPPGWPGSVAGVVAVALAGVALW